MFEAKSMEEQQKPWIKTRMIVEIAGFPKEHIDDALKRASENFGKESKKVKVTNKNIKESQHVKMGEIKDTKIFSGFVEFGAEVEDFSTLVGLVFDWMPSSVEIIEPEKVAENTRELNNVLNDLACKLHQYDAAVKKLKAKAILLAKELAKYKPSQEQKDK